MGTKMLRCNDEISVKIISALEDLLVVSYNYRNRVFQGVLLDSTNRSSPFGVNPVGGFQQRLEKDNPRDHHAQTEIANKQSEEDYPTLTRRHTYFQDGKEDKPPLRLPRKGGTQQSFLSGQNLGVRLRARQVLCNKCSSVCNERGENVRDSSTKLKDVQKKPPKKLESLTKTKFGPKDATFKVPLKVSRSNKSKGGTNADSNKNNKRKRKLEVQHGDMLLTRFGLKPKVRRLSISEIENCTTNSIAERGGEASVADEGGKAKVEARSKVAEYSPAEELGGSGESIAVTSTSSSENLNQPVKIRFSNLAKQRLRKASNGIQCSIITQKPDDTDCDRNLKPIENNQSIKIQRKESKKVLKMSKVINLPGPVLKICIGKGPMGSGLKCSNGSFEPKPGPSRGGAQNEPVKIVIPKALTCGSKAARRLIKKAKKKILMSPRNLPRRSPAYLPPSYRQSRSPSYLQSRSPSYLSTGSPSYLPSRSPSYLSTRNSPAHSFMVSPARVSPFPSPAQSFGTMSPGPSLISPIYTPRLNPCPPASPACPSPAYTLVCPDTTQKIIIRKKKKKKQKAKEQID